MNSFKKTSLTQFLEQIDINQLHWFAKRLSGNDTGITGGHQVGIYLPKNLTEALFPELLKEGAKVPNPDIYIENCYFPDDDASATSLRVIYYNNRLVYPDGKKGTRDEVRITRWGGKNSPVQTPENTGSLFLFAVVKHEHAWHAVAWVAKNLEEENLIESWTGQEVEPGRIIYHPDETTPRSPQQIVPVEWLQKFPASREIAQYVIGKIPHDHKHISGILLKRRSLEYDLFKLLEEKDVLPSITKGFETVDQFISFANSVANRRKSRTGASLETHLEAIFLAEQLRFETQVITENRKKPDFLFPSGSDYHNFQFPDDKLYMLAAKTCCKDRWRQVISEADRIQTKHLFTLQEGISSNQIEEMQASQVQLVIPKQNLSSFPNDKRESLLVLENFIETVRFSQETA